MSTAAFIAVDWGTSNARFALCDEDRHALEIRNGPGAAESRGRFAEVFDATVADWRKAHGELPAFLSGMAGSSLGWVEAPYLPCPADLIEVADTLVKIRDGVHVVPGLRCTNPLGAPDVLRGEETQLLGALEISGSLKDGHGLVCMPGTHTKWVSLFDGVAQEFITAPTGEIFASLCEHTVLVRDQATAVVHRAEDFQLGLAEAHKHPGRLLHQIFQARSLRLDKQLPAEGATSWLSGLLIGTDVHGALALFDTRPPQAPVYVVGTPQLAGRYRSALERHGLEVMEIDGADAAIRGLACVFDVQNGVRG
jgi:2-dehydro-3-deoxygalactonokinase